MVLKKILSLLEEATRNKRLLEKNISNFEKIISDNSAEELNLPEDIFEILNTLLYDLSYLVMDYNSCKFSL